MKRPNKWWYWTLCFVAAAVLESLPRFLSEIQKPYFLIDRFVLLGLFLFVAWFFSRTLHTEWRWSITSSIFAVDMFAALVLSMLLFLQLFSGAFAFITLAIVLTRAGIFSYLASHRLPYLRGLVFFTCFVLLVAGEIVLTIGFNPFF